jgi:hypothetical protein
MAAKVREPRGAGKPSSRPPARQRPRAGRPVASTRAASSSGQRRQNFRPTSVEQIVAQKGSPSSQPDMSATAYGAGLGKVPSAVTSERRVAPPSHSPASSTRAQSSAPARWRAKLPRALPGVHSTGHILWGTPLQAPSRSVRLGRVGLHPPTVPMEPGLRVLTDTEGGSTNRRCERLPMSPTSGNRPDEFSRLAEEART